MNEFHNVKVDVSERNPNRLNIYVLPATKRWIKVDLKSESLSISLDHLEDEINLSDVLATNVTYAHQKGRSGVKVTPSEESFDAVHFTFHKNDPYDFNNAVFKAFLEKHYRAYLKRVGI